MIGLNYMRTLILQNFLNSRRVIDLKPYSPKQFQKRFCSTDYDTEDIIEKLCKGDEDLEKKLRILMLEVEVMRQDGRSAPSVLQTRHWEHMLTLHSRSQRSSYLLYLMKSEKSKENTKLKKEARRKELESAVPEDVKEHNDDLLYGIKHQSLFLRIRDQSINKMDNYRALQSMLYGQSLVIDCSYDEHMVMRETLNASKQTSYVFGDNRIHKEPFNLHMCNVNFKGNFMKQLHRHIPSIDEPWFPINFHEESYLDLFPKEKLVYLTPHCKEELIEFDHDAVYIIGCMVDKTNNEPLSLAKAKRDKLKMAKLPLDRYLEWAPGSKKNLNINHMVPILLDLKVTGDWEFALRHVPRRKLMQTKILAMQNRIKNNPELKNEIAQNWNRYSKKNFMLSRAFPGMNRQRARQSLYHDDESK